MGIWDDVDYRKCERCGEMRLAAAMSVKWPSRFWICTPCEKLRKQALKDLADLGQEFEKS